MPSYRYFFSCCIFLQSNTMNTLYPNCHILQMSRKGDIWAKVDSYSFQVLALFKRYISTAVKENIVQNMTKA